MTAKKGKTTSGGRKNTSNRRTSSGKNTGRSNHKESNGPDLLTVVVVLAAVVLVLVLISKYKGSNEEAGTHTPTAPASATDVPNNNEPTKEIKPSKVPEATPQITVSGKEEPDTTPTDRPALSVEEAKGILRGKIEQDKYEIELLDDHLMIDGDEYYSFCINDEDGKEMEPLLIVNKKDGSLFCYDLRDGVSVFSKFPLDRTETGGFGEEKITENEAKKILAGYSKEALGLSGDVSDYVMTPDEWTTMANGVECYGINLFGKDDILYGTYYVALNGSAVYFKDDITGEFIER